MTRLTFPVLLALALSPAARAEDWPMLGRDRTHNAVSAEKNAPTDWQTEIRDKDGKVTQISRNIAWSAKLGSSSIGGPVVADGLVWVSTNNESPRDLQFTDPKRLNRITKK